MKIEQCTKESFVVIGKEGSTLDGNDFIQKLWEDNFSKDLYLAGVECDDNAEAPEGWTKWIVPGYEYIYVECEGGNTFSQVITYMNENDIPLVGAVHDFTCPQTGKNYMFFPIKNID